MSVPITMLEHYGVQQMLDEVKNRGDSLNNKADMHNYLTCKY